MEQFLARFENGKLLNLAKEIGAENILLTDIKNVFSVEYSAYWNGSTGEDELLKLITEYEAVKETNLLLNTMCCSSDEAFKAWRETLKFIGFSHEAVKGKYPVLNKLFSILFKIAKKEDLLPADLKQLVEELRMHTSEIKGIMENKLSVFIEIYKPYLDGFNDVECDDIRKSITTDMFILDITQGNANVKKAADEYRKNQIKTQMYKLWSDKAEGTKNPRMWSERFRTPILCCIKPDAYSAAKKAFSVLNANVHSDTDIKSTIEFLENASFFDEIGDASYRDTCFREIVIGEYAKMLTDLSYVKDAIDAMGYDVYEWIDNPEVKNKIKALAIAEYNAGGSDNVVSFIETMPDAEVKTWLSDLVKKDMDLGLRIISSGGK